MGTHIRGLLFALMLVAGAEGAAAQDSASIRGVVRDHTGTPLPGAVITLAHPDEAQVRVVITDLEGEYRVDGLEAATEYRLEISHPQFRKRELRIRPGTAAGETIRLDPRAARKRD
jgi:hypothetical protein